MQELLTEKEVAKLLKLSHRTIQLWRLKNKGPNHIKIGKNLIRYRLEDVQNWVEKNKFIP